MHGTTKGMPFARRGFALFAALLLASADQARADLTLLTPEARSLASFESSVSLSSDSNFTPVERPEVNLGSFDIVINPGPLLAANSAALAAFNRAAAQWEAFISDPITVTINAEISNALPPGVIGATSPVTLNGGYNTVRNAMANDALDEPDDAVAQVLPTIGQYSVTLPNTFTLGGLSLTKANAKALGFGGLDAMFGVSDATITFNANFSFDYDNSNGVGAGLTDFETTAAHEIGHALGFLSDVDFIDFAIANNLPIPNRLVFPTTLDMFRFDDGGLNDPSTLAQFTIFPRSMVPGNAEVFDQITGAFGGAPESLMSTGLANGDSRQASHWKDNALTSVLVGMMDPTLGPGLTFTITPNDLRALDLIGYEISAIPEAAAWLFGALAAATTGAVRAWRKKRA